MPETARASLLIPENSPDEFRELTELVSTCPRVYHDLAPRSTCLCDYSWEIMSHIVLLILLFAALSQQGSPAEHPLPKYVLSCTRGGTSVPCIVGDCADCPMLCNRADNSGPLPSGCSADVDRVEYRVGAGRNQCELNAPPRTLFGEVRGAVFDDRIALIRVTTRQQPSHPIVFACEINASGLVPFNPPLTCVNCECAYSGSYGLIFYFENGYFGSSVSLKYDFSQHSVVFAGAKIQAFPLGTGAYGLPVLEIGTSSSTVEAATALDVYSDHRSNAPRITIKVSQGDSVRLLQAWAPVAMEPVDKGPSGLRIVRYNQGQEWLQIEVKRQTGWIRGAGSFSAIGLPPPPANQ